MNLSRSVDNAGMRMARSCVLVVVLALAGCGFHLQGGYQLPAGVDALYVAHSNPYRVGQPPLVDALRQRLRVKGMLGDSSADARLVITNIDNGRRIVSISPIDGDVAEYQLRSEVVFDYIVDGQTLLSGAHFAVTRSYSYNDTARLAGEAEQRALLEQMQQQLADRILFRISRVQADEDERS